MVSSRTVKIVIVVVLMDALEMHAAIHRPVNSIQTLFAILLMKDAAQISVNLHQLEQSAELQQDNAIRKRHVLETMQLALRIRPSQMAQIVEMVSDVPAVNVRLVICSARQ